MHTKTASKTRGVVIGVLRVAGELFSNVSCTPSSDTRCGQFSAGREDEAVTENLLALMSKIELYRCSKEEM